MEREIKIEWQEIDDEYTVILTKDGFQWNTVYSNEDINKCLTILEAYEKIGYKNVSVMKYGKKN